MKQYKIKQFSQYMGVTVDTVKHYQQCEILKPVIDPENNYRYYNITHGERLIVSRRFRNLGFTVDETKELISSKDGHEIHDMLNKRQTEIQAEIKQLEASSKNIEYLTMLCELFNHQVGSVQVCECPAYYFYRHTYNFAFIEEDHQEVLTRELMAQLPNAVKMMILPHDSLKSRRNHNFFHSIAIREDLSGCVCKEQLLKLEYMPAHPAVCYVYSRPHTHEKISLICDIYEDLQSKGYELTTDDIIIENAIDHYIDGTRFENYLIYFPIIK